jgi:hypothetical protein
MREIFYIDHEEGQETLAASSTKAIAFGWGGLRRLFCLQPNRSHLRLYTCSYIVATINADHTTKNKPTTKHSKTDD